MCIRDSYRHFARGLASAEQWRAWRDFRHGVAYLDIETTGCAGYDQVTVVGIYDGKRTTCFIAGDNLDRLPEALAQYSMLVTYNGASFDLPFLRRCFPGMALDQIHVDLMHVLRRLDLHGGLELTVARIFSVRLGADRGRFTLGGGLTMWGLSLDYCWLSHELGSTHRVSLSAAF